MDRFKRTKAIERAVSKFHDRMERYIRYYPLTVTKYHYLCDAGADWDAESYHLCGGYVPNIDGIGCKYEDCDRCDYDKHQGIPGDNEITGEQAVEFIRKQEAEYMRKERRYIYEEKLLERQKLWGY